MRYTFFLLLIALFIPSSPTLCNGAGSADSAVPRSLDRVIARVNSEPITELEVQAVQAANPDMSFSKALGSLIDQRLVLSWARKNNVRVTQADIIRAEKAIMQNNNMTEDQFKKALDESGQDRESFRNDLKDQILINKAVSIALEPAVRIDEEQIKKRYEALYPPKKTFTISHILLKPDVSSGRDDVFIEKLAQSILDRLRGGASFEDLAKEYSEDDTTAGKGGFLGTFKEGELFPELEKLALKLKPGEVGGPVRTPMGFHILKVDAKGLTEPPPLSRVRDKIRSDLLSQKEPEAREQWLKKLKGEAFIKIFDDGE